MKRVGSLMRGLFIGMLCMLAVPALASADGHPPSVLTASKPVNTSPPTLTGTPVVGQTLTCSEGSWENSPTSYSYAWLRNGSPIAGQVASTYTLQSIDQGTSITCTVTAGNPGGEYTISSLPSGSYTVQFFSDREVVGTNYLFQYYDGKSLSTEAAPVSVTEPNTTAGINAAMQVGGQITGKVTGAPSGAAIAKAEACADEEGGAGVDSCGETNAAGEYTISGLPSGSYDVGFSPPYEGGNYLIQVHPSVPVTVPNTTSGINAELPVGGQIIGKVSGSGSALANVEVCADAESGAAFESCGSTNVAGEYTISGLPSGSYNVSFSDFVCGPESCEQENYLNQYYNDKTSSSEADLVSVKEGEVTSLMEATLKPGGQIAGKVTSASSGAGIASAEACAQEGAEVEFCGFANSSGEYTISGLPKGTYHVEFYGDEVGDDYLSQYYNGKTSLATADPVSVEVGAKHSGINAKLLTAGQITGKITGAPSGAALASAEVCAEEEGGESFGCASANAAGEYTISSLPSGSYDLGFSPGYESGNYLSQSHPSVSVEAPNTVSGINAELQPGAQISGKVTSASSGAPIEGVEACAYEISGGSGGCGTTNNAAVAASATSSALHVSVASSTFTLAKTPVFDSKTGDLDFFFKFADAGTLGWNLSFKNADVGFADSLGSSLNDAAVLAETAKKKSKSSKCKAGFTKHKSKCVHTLVPFASGSQSVAEGTVEVKVHASSKAIKALKAGKTLHVSGKFTFRPVAGGAAVVQAETAVVHGQRAKKKASKKHHK